MKPVFDVTYLEMLSFLAFLWAHIQRLRTVIWKEPDLSCFLIYTCVFLSFFPTSINFPIIPPVLPFSLILLPFLLSPAIHYRSVWRVPGGSLPSSTPLGERQSSKAQHSLCMLILSLLIIHNDSDHHWQFPQSLGWQQRDSKAVALHVCWYKCI